ncbi:hypothetical protein N7528_002340 [Penicillium herquei]|nr:hypothetical protein N7528_002340 [Penicillium herquei]
MRVLYYTSVCLFGTALAIPVHSQGAQALSERQAVPLPPGASEPVVADQPKPKTLGEALDSLLGERDSAPNAQKISARQDSSMDDLFDALDSVLGKGSNSEKTSSGNQNENIPVEAGKTLESIESIDDDPGVSGDAVQVIH